MSLSTREQKLCADIESRRADLLADLKLHVGIPTGGMHLAGLDETRERFAARLSALGASTRLIPGDPKPVWLMGPTPVDPKENLEWLPTAVCENRADGMPCVLIAGHLDTVHDPNDASFNALAVSSDGKTGIGPGCVDMKGGLVIAMAALEALAAAGESVSWTFLMNSDEETGSFHSASALREVSRSHDWGLALEPALPDGSLAVERMGSGQFMIESRGRSAHVGRAYAEGVSAVTALAERLVSISTFSDPEAGRIVSVGPLEGGKTTNAVPDLARAWGNVRFGDKASEEAIGIMLRGLATDKTAMPRVDLEMTFSRPAKPLTPQTERLAGLARTVSESLGMQLPFARTGGVCDGNIMQDAGLTTIDTVGVRGGGLHTRDEWIEIDSLVGRAQMLAILVSRICSGALGS